MSQTPSRRARTAKRRAEALRRAAKGNAARQGGWIVEGDARKGMTLHFGAAR